MSVKSTWIAGRFPATSPPPARQPPATPAQRPRSQNRCACLDTNPSRPDQGTTDHKSTVMFIIVSNTQSRCGRSKSGCAEKSISIVLAGCAALDEELSVLDGAKEAPQCGASRRRATLARLYLQHRLVSFQHGCNHCITGAAILRQGSRFFCSTCNRGTVV